MRTRWRVFVVCATTAFISGVVLTCVGSAFATVPDNRAYELVSPVEKGGLSFLAGLAVVGSSAEHVIVDGGSRNALLSNGASWMLETRTGSGWSGVQIGPPPTAEANFSEQEEVSLNGVSEDFSRFAFQARMPLDPRDSTRGMAEYVRSGTTGPFVWASGPPAPASPVSEPGECEGGAEPAFCVTNRAVFAGASSDMRDLVWGQFYPLLAPPAHLAGYPADTHEHGYEVYQAMGGADELVGLVPAGGSIECGPSAGSCVVPPCGAAMGNQDASSPFFGGFAPVRGAVSGDGSQVIFTSPDPSTGCAPPAVYVRQHGVSTVDVSASEKKGGDPNGPQAKVYAGSSGESGQINTVFFTSREELTEDANTGVADEGNDLYAYSMPTGSHPGVLKDLTPENNTPGAGGVEVTFLGASTSGRYVYFTASSVLTSEPNAHGEAAQPGVSNLYLYDAGTGHTTFIAPGSGLKGPHIGLSYGLEAAGRLTSEVTPDGRHLVFVSKERLSEYDNFGPECVGSESSNVPVRSSGPCGEVYLYTVATNSLVCVSCDPSGAPPVGSARLPERLVEGYLDRGVEPGTLQVPRAVSDDGGRVFFSSPDQLTVGAPTPTTTRGSQAPMALVWEYEPNVYEYEGGGVHLIAPSAVLLNSTPSGNDVFFDTFTQILPQDRDGSPDVYDARVSGGFPVLAPPACTGSACQGTPAAPTVFATPPTATFTGVRNFPPAPLVKPKPKHCKKGFTLRRKRCVKAKAKSKRAKAKRATHRKEGV